jgi:hypothetical protein
MSDAELRNLIRNYEASPDQDIAFQLVREYLRVTNNAREQLGMEGLFQNRALLRNYISACEANETPLELSIFAENPNLQSIADIAHYSCGVQLYGFSSEAIIGQIENRAPDDLRQMWDNDPDSPPADMLPEVDYVGWIPEFDVAMRAPIGKHWPSDLLARAQLVIVFHTEREQFTGYRTLVFWYGIYQYDHKQDRFRCAIPWNIANAPQEVPPTLETVRSNHPGLITLYNNLDIARIAAVTATEEINEAVGTTQALLDRNITLYIMSEAGNLDYRAEQLETMPTISQGQFSNLKEEITLNLDQFPDSMGEYELTKPDGPHIRVWLSRMTREDGDQFDNAVEIEIYNLDEGRWEEYRRYDSNRRNPEEPPMSEENIKRICMICHKFLGGNPEGVHISHGYCKECGQDAMDELMRSLGTQ